MPHDSLFESILDLLFAPAQFGQLFGQLFDPWTELRFRQFPSFEGIQVAIKSGLALGNITLDPPKFLYEIRPAGVERLSRSLKRLADQVGSLVRLTQSGEHSLVKLLGRKPVARTGGNPVALSGVADVVGIPGTSPVGGGTDVVLAAPGAEDEATQEVVRGVGATKRTVFAALFEKHLGRLEDGGINKRRVGRRVVGSPEEDLTEVGAVSEHR
ncbi:MAG: hypothetical protein ABSG81_14650 [Acidimicrobiales bacterium]